MYPRQCSPRWLCVCKKITPWHPIDGNCVAAFVQKCVDFLWESTIRPLNPSRRRRLIVRPEILEGFGRCSGGVTLGNDGRPPAPAKRNWKYLSREELSRLFSVVSSPSKRDATRHTYSKGPNKYNGKGTEINKIRESKQYFLLKTDATPHKAKPWTQMGEATFDRQEKQQRGIRVIQSVRISKRLNFVVKEILLHSLCDLMYICFHDGIQCLNYFISYSLRRLRDSWHFDAIFFYHAFILTWWACGGCTGTAAPIKRAIGLETKRFIRFLRCANSNLSH